MSQDATRATDPGDDSASVEELVFRCLESDAPARRLEQLAVEHPAHAAALRRVFAKLEQGGLVAAQVDANGDAIPERLGQFRLRGRLGAGGMGIVYIADDEALGRSVALKLIRPDQLYFHGARERFRREVQTVARLQHPGIVQVYAAGEHEGLPFFTMERVAGASLADAIAALKRTRTRPSGPALAQAIAQCAETPPARDHARASAPTPDTCRWPQSWPETCAAIAIQVAEALHHAHEHGVLHRDVKPSNILLTPSGRAQLVDFGLAWNDDEAQRLTRPTSQLGSLPYLPPEVVSGRTRAPSRSADVYALGVTLYEMLVLENPFLAATAHETQRRILAAAPPRPRRIDATIPAALETACLVAMDPEPALRYPTAGALAHDLAHARDAQPIAARRPSVRVRARRWLSRHPAVATGLVVAPLAAVAGFLAFALHERAARLTADELSRVAEQERYAALLVAANVELGAGLRPLLARRLLADCRPSHRGWEWRYLEFKSDASTATLRFDEPIAAIVWSPDGARLVAATTSGALRLVSPDGTELARASDAPASCLAFRPQTEGRELYSGSSDGKVHRRDGASGRVLAELTGGPHAHTSGITAIAFTPDGERMFTASADQRVAAWDVARNAWLGDLAEHGIRASTLAVSRDGRLVASGGYDGTVHVVDAATLARVRTLRASQFVVDLEFSASATSLFVADGQTLLAYDLRASDTRPVALPMQERNALAVTLSPSGDELTMVTGRRALQVYALGTERSRPVVRLLGASGLVLKLAYHPDGTQIVAASDSRIVHLYRPSYAAEHRTSRLGTMIVGTAVLEQGNVVALDSKGRHHRIDLATRRVQPLAPQPDAVAIGRTSRGWFTVAANGHACLWAASAAAPLHELTTLDGASAACARDAGDGDELVVATRDGEVATFALPDGTRRRSWQAHETHIHRVVAGAGKLWTAAVDGTLRQRNAATGTLERELERHPMWIADVVWCEAGGWLATGCADTDIRMFDVASGALRRRLRGHGRVPLALVATPAGDRLISSGGHDNELRVWDTGSGRCLLVMTTDVAVTELAFASAGERLICGTRFGEIVWLQPRPGGPREIDASVGSEPDHTTSAPGAGATHGR